LPGAQAVAEVEQLAMGVGAVSVPGSAKLAMPDPASEYGELPPGVAGCAPAAFRLMRSPNSPMSWMAVARALVVRVSTSMRI
jgi:hypothetical protein